ncbi:hypothetical protein [Brevibacillus borstelensis]|uniref:hypothetical protein n=1 Tax=Brevibacillus borstelensis TaxID=45462 RepID=UPI00046ADC91|nr:hypothetical protein [Brevibacillus borstelensis]
MPINYVIRADVIDIRSDMPKAEDEYLIDTNIWYWMTYSRASLASRPPGSYQITNYPTYIVNALTANAKLYRCNLSLAELAHIIERTEREIYNNSHISIGTKEYRHNYPAERANVVSQVKAAWSQVKSMASPIESLIVDETMADNALIRFSTQLLDGYDLFILESIEKTGIVKVITDDGDYTSVPNIQVFTANKNLIEAARVQGKLMVR